MKKINRYAQKLTRPSDALLPAALILASAFGRSDITFDLFVACLAVRLCALATSSGLRTAFARQPSMRYVQGSALLALIMQPAGAIIAALVLQSLHPMAWQMVACGLLLNIEHVFYEYLFAVGDCFSAALCQGITALLALTGTLLGAPPLRAVAGSTAYSWVGLLLPLGAAALVSVVIGLSLGGPFNPRLNAHVLRSAPGAMLQTALYPALAIGIAPLQSPRVSSAIPLFAGLALYELCRTPFRRTPAESLSMCRALLIVCVLSALCALSLLVSGRIIGSEGLIRDIPWACAAVILAALCAFALFGNIPGREADAR